MSNLEGMDTPDTLAGYTKCLVEQGCAELEGESDFMPFVTLRTHAGDLHHIGVVMPTPDQTEIKDAIGDLMTGECLLHRPSEMTFASAVWSVQGSAQVRDADKYPDLAHHPDRQELASIMEITADGEFTTHYAPIIRENGKVGVGLWKSSRPGVGYGGRFAEAMMFGMELAKGLPPEMIAYLDRSITEGTEGETLTSVMRAMRTVRGMRESAAEN